MGNHGGGAIAKPQAVLITSLDRGERIAFWSSLRGADTQSTSDQVHQKNTSTLVINGTTTGEEKVALRCSIRARPSHSIAPRQRRKGEEVVDENQAQRRWQVTADLNNISRWVGCARGPRKLRSPRKTEGRYSQNRAQQGTLCADLRFSLSTHRNTVARGLCQVNLQLQSLTTFDTSRNHLICLSWASFLSQTRSYCACGQLASPSCCLSPKFAVQDFFLFFNQ